LLPQRSIDTITRSTVQRRSSTRFRKDDDAVGVH
jgi:hypothetical protein